MLADTQSRAVFCFCGCLVKCCICQGFCWLWAQVMRVVVRKKMRQQDFTALDPLGKALLAYWRGDKSTQIIQEYRSGQTKSIPISVFFRNFEDFYPTEHVKDFCRGRILVVGAGTGVHALELERQGYKVTAVVELHNKWTEIFRIIRQVAQNRIIAMPSPTGDSASLRQHCNDPILCLVDFNSYFKEITLSFYFANKANLSQIIRKKIPFSMSFIVQLNSL